MLKLVQILILSLQWFQSNGDPILFQGISIKRTFDISMDSLPIKPLTFIKEKWSPFGAFRKKHTIQRRDLDNLALEDIPQGSESIPVGLVIKKQSSIVVPLDVKGSLSYPEKNVPEVPMLSVPIVNVPSAPVFEETDPVTVAPLYIQPVPPVMPENTPPQEAISPVLETTIVEQPEVPALVVSPSPPVLEIVPPIEQPVPPIVQPVSIIEQPVVISPVVAPPLPSVSIIVPPEAAPALPPKIVPLVVEKPSIPGSVILPSAGLVPVLSVGTVQEIIPVAVPPSINTVPLENRSPDLFTDIFRVAPGLINNSFGKRILPSIESNSIDGLANQNESSFVRRSKMALYLGNVLLRTMSQLLGSARVTLDRLTSPPPVYLN